MKPRDKLPLSAYAPYIRAQALWGGALFMLSYTLLFVRGCGRGWLASIPADSFALTLAVCFLLYLPLAVVCCIAGFIVSRLQLRGNASGVILSVVTAVATYAAALLLLTLFSTWDVKMVWEIMPTLLLIAPCAAISALILSARLPQTPPADEAQPTPQKSPPAATHAPAATTHTGQVRALSMKDYAFYISAQTLLGGTLTTLIFVLFMADDDVFLPALSLYITFCAPFAVVCWHGLSHWLSAPVPRRARHHPFHRAYRRHLHDYRTALRAVHRGAVLHRPAVATRAVIRRAVRLGFVRPPAAGTACLNARCGSAARRRLPCPRPDALRTIALHAERHVSIHGNIEE